MASVNTLQAKVWTLRVLVVVGLMVLCVLAGSGTPSLAFALAWGPNGLFLVLFQKGVLMFPSSLERVHPAEPVVYRALGVGFVKRIVATRMWPLLLGMEPPPVPTNREQLLEHIVLSTKGAEICHAATFVLASVVALWCLIAGKVSAAAWILAFNMLLNGYPVMLQRSNRSRVQQLRTSRLA